MLLGACVIAGALAPRTVSAQDRDSRDYARLGLNVGMGFLGQQDFDGSETDLAMTLTVDARFENPVSRYFTFGGLLSTNFWSTDDLIGDAAKRNVRFDLDMILKPRVAWRTGRGHLELGLPIPVGFTLDLDDRGTQRNEPYYGWNVGVLVSLQYVPKRSVGLFTEFGWKRHQTYHSDLPDLITGELMLNVGFIFLLAG